jgi:REP-associated tyrosine transposase
MSGTYPQRRSLRLRDYDYSLAGAYVVTICTHQRTSLFGWIVDSELWLGTRGEVVDACWREVPEHYPQVELDAFVVMPNHVHGIIVIGDASEDQALRAADAGATCRAPTVGRKPRLERSALGHIVRSFKAASTKAIRALETGGPQVVWQRGYHEHVIRSEAALARIRQYIVDNPAKWAFDHDNPAN